MLNARKPTSGDLLGDGFIFTSSAGEKNQACKKIIAAVAMIGLRLHEMAPETKLPPGFQT